MNLINDLFKKIFALYAMLMFVFFTGCEESLPVRTKPQVCLEVTSVLANQGTTSGGQIIEFLIIAKNIYEETLQDTLNIRGEIHVWWKRRPEFEAHLVLLNSDIMSPPTKIWGGQLTMDPGDFVAFRKQWYLITDNNEYIPDFLDYSNGYVRGDIMYAAPEDFCFEAVITVYSQVGLLEVYPVTFTYRGWKRINYEK